MCFPRFGNSSEIRNEKNLTFLSFSAYLNVLFFNRSLLDSCSNDRKKNCSPRYRNLSILFERPRKTIREQIYAVTRRKLARSTDYIAWLKKKLVLERLVRKISWKLEENIFLEDNFNSWRYFEVRLTAERNVEYFAFRNSLRIEFHLFSLRIHEILEKLMDNQKLVD